MLPISTNGKKGSSSRRQPAGVLQIYLRRLLKPNQLDFQLALWTMWQLIVSPKTAYKQVGYHKQTKNQWARDDPAFVVISAAIVASITFVYCLIFAHRFWRGVTAMVHAVIVNYLIFGFIVASLIWFIANKLLTKRAPHSHSVVLDQTVEWPYAFDIHCNACVPLFLILGVAQLAMMPALLLNSWFAALLSNVLYTIAMTAYFYCVFLGLSSLPTLENTEVFLYPIGAVGVGMIMSLLVGFNPTKFVLALLLGYSRR